MSVWRDYNWDSQKSLNGSLIAIFMAFPFLYYSYELVGSCPADLFFTGENFDVLTTRCGLGTNFGVLVLVLVYIPMYILSIVQGNGWVKQLKFKFFELVESL